MRNELHTTEESLKAFRERLTQLRKQHSQTIEQACEYIKEKSGTKITRKTYSNWTHLHTDSNGIQKYCAPSIDNLLAIANAYNVSTDFLLGLSDYTSPERDHIGKATGLDDNAIKSLQAIKKTAPDNMPYINFIIDGTRIGYIAEHFRKLVNPVQSIQIHVDPDSGELEPVTEKNCKDRANIRAVSYDASNGRALGFSSKLMEQTALNLLSDEFRSMRDAWDSEHRDK